MDGWINIDLTSFWKTDMKRDITRGLPFDDNSVDEIYTEHCLEHIGPDDIQFVIKEMWRVCKDKTKISIVVPVGDGLMNFPEHKSFWNEKSAVFFTDWNIPQETGYEFRLISSKVVDVGTEIDTDKRYGKELHFVLEVKC